MSYEAESSSSNEPLARTPVTRQHVAKYLTIDGRRIRIDANIAQLVSGLDRLGIRTFSSCDSGCGGWCKRKHKQLPDTSEWTKVKGKKTLVKVSHHKKPKQCSESVWLAFESATDAMKMLNVVYDNDDAEKLQCHMQGFGRKQSHAWVWNVGVDNINDRGFMDSRGYWRGTRFGPAKFDFFCNVVFPHAHLGLVTQRVIDKCNKKRTVR